MKRPNPEEVPKDPANPTQFGPPIIAAGVTDPTALRYAQGIASRKGPPKFAPPVSGGPGPAIPRLDAPAVENLTMADQAAIQRAAAAPSAPAQMPSGGMFQGSAPPPAPQPPAQPYVPGLSRPPGILPTDILPQEATQDPAYREGQGSLYATNQPHLAYKYGVIRNNQRVPPQLLQQPQKGLSEKTIAGLQALQSAQPPAPHPLLDNEDKRIDRESAASTAGAGVRLAGGSPDTPPKLTAEEATEVAKKMDDFDFHAFRERLMKDLLNNDEQREIIEKRCEPLTIDDLLVRGFITQRVPIIPGKFEPEFQSMSGEDDLAIKRLIMLEAKAVEVSDRYILDKFALMSVVLATRAINSNAMPDYRDAQGKFDEDKFWKKFEYLTRFPLHMLASLGVNAFWFDTRVRKLFVAEKLGNG